MNKRLLSVDVFRGATIMLMTIVNNPGNWDAVYAPFLHAEWHGCTPTDLVFPFFLFVVGISVVLSMPNQNLDIFTFQKIVTRTLRIFLLGLFLNFFSKIHLLDFEGTPLLAFRLFLTLLVMILLMGNYDKKYQFFGAISLFLLMLFLAFGGFEDFKAVRIPGVLQRIAIVYFIVSILYLKTKTSFQIFIGIAFLMLYWFLMGAVDVPNVGAANFEKGTNLAAWLDNYLLEGHLWAVSKTWDPEGVLSTIPAIVTGLAGMFTGKLLRSQSINNQNRFAILFISGIVSIILGLAWNIYFPINKALWTSSYVVYTAGIALVLLSILYYLIEIQHLSFWTKPFVIFGVNPMLVFFFSGIIPRALNMIKVAVPNVPEPIGLQNYLYTYHIATHFSDPKMASMAGAITYLIIWFVILLILYRKKIILKV